jgi:hypothetical protein
MVWIYAILALLLTLPLYVALREPVWNVPVIGIFVGLLAALCYLIWARLKRPKKDSEPGKEPVVSPHERSRKVMLLMGFVALAVGVSEIYFLVDPSDSRRVSLVTQLLQYLMGPLGPLLVFFGSGIALLLFAWKRR